MAYVAVPKDVTKVKTKALFGLTKRQLICFGAALVLGLPLFFLLRPVNTSLAAMCMIIVMLPLFMVAMYEKNGQPAEKLLMHYIQARFIRPKQRPYQTNNFYSVLERQANLDQEVKSIVKKKKYTRQVDTRREKENHKRNRTGKASR